HLKLFATIKEMGIGVHATLQILAMYSLCPTISELRMHWPSSKVQPCLIDVGAEFVRARHPDQDWRGVGNQSETLFAFLDCFFCPLALRDVVGNFRETYKLAA